MNLQEYQQQKAAIMNAYRQRQLGFVKSMQAAKAHMKASLLEIRAAADTDFSKQPRVNHSAHLRRGAHGVVRYLTKVLAEKKWDTQEFAFDPDNLSIGFDIDKEKNEVTFHFTIPTVKH